MDASSDASPFHITEEDTSANEATGGMSDKNRKLLQQAQKAKRKKNKMHRKRVKGRTICDLKRENAEMKKEIDNMISKAAEMNKQGNEFSNVMKGISNQENLVETLLQEPLVQELVLGADKVEAPLLGNRLDGTGEVKDRATMLAMQIDWLCRLFVNECERGDYDMNNEKDA